MDLKGREVEFVFGKQDPFAQTEVEAPAPGGVAVPSQAASDAEITAQNQLQPLEPDRYDESENAQGEADFGGRSSEDIGYALYYLLDQVSGSASSGLDEPERQRLKDLLKREETIRAAGIVPSVYALILSGQQHRMDEFAMNTLNDSHFDRTSTAVLQGIMDAAPEEKDLLLQVLGFLDRSMGFHFNSLLPFQTTPAPTAPEAAGPVWAATASQMSNPNVYHDKKREAAILAAKQSLEEVIEQLILRYGTALPLQMSLNQLAAANPDLPIGNINYWSIRAYEETARLYLRRRGILGSAGRKNLSRLVPDPLEAVGERPTKQTDPLAPHIQNREQKQGLPPLTAGAPPSRKGLGSQGDAGSSFLSGPSDNRPDQAPEPGEADAQLADCLQIPHHLQKKYQNTVKRLWEFYPDGEVKDLYQASRKLGEAVAFLTRSLGFPDRSDFLKSLGFTLAPVSTGRPNKNDYHEVIEELKRRYASAEKELSVADLTLANPDLPLKSLANMASKLFGMKLGPYLDQLGILDRGQHAGKGSSSVKGRYTMYEKRLKAVTEALRERYQDELPIRLSLHKLSHDNPDLRITSMNEITRRLHRETLSQYLDRVGIIESAEKRREKNREASSRLARQNLEEITQKLRERYGEQLPLAKQMRDLVRENPDLEILSINAWARAVHNESAKAYLFRSGILKEIIRQSYSDRARNTPKDFRYHYLSERLERAAAGYSSYYTRSRLNLTLCLPHVPHVDAGKKEALLWQVSMVQDEPGYEDGLYLEDYLGYEEEVVVPVSIQGVPIKGIAQAAFQSCAARVVSLPGYYSHLPALAFFNNPMIETVKLGRGLKSLHQTAFLQAQKLSLVMAHEYPEWIESCQQQSEGDQEANG